MRARCYFLTWNNPPDTGDTLLQTLGAEKYCYQLEQGKEGTKHYQGVFSFRNARWRTSLVKACPGSHWEKARNLKACVIYCSKLDTRIGEVKSKGFEIPEVVKVLREEQLYPWQKKVMNILAREPDDRTIRWYYDVDGKAGKTVFCKFLLQTQRDVAYVAGSGKDILYAISKFVEEHKRGPRVVLYDLPRSSARYLNYASMEKAKDGVFFSGKYESGWCSYNCPHLIVFANQEPDYTQLSVDRWVVENLKKYKQGLYKFSGK